MYRIDFRKNWFRILLGICFVIIVVITLLFIQKSPSGDVINTPLPIVYTYYTNEKEGLAVCAGDQAMGTYALQVYSTKDGGKSWTLETEAQDKFIAVSINAKYLFINEKVGFIFSPSRSESSANVWITKDGGKNFNTLSLVDDTVIKTYPNGEELKKNEAYDYYQLPTYENEIINIIISQGSDGEKLILKYQSKDMGETWELIEEYI